MADPTVDAATFRELQETAGADFVDELAATFAEEAPGLLAELRRAHAAGDAPAFARAAHSLKSNAHTFGAFPLGALARTLELQGAPAGADGDRALDALAAELERALFAMDALRRG